MLWTAAKYVSHSEPKIENIHSEIIGKKQDPSHGGLYPSLPGESDTRTY